MSTLAVSSQTSRLFLFYTSDKRAQKGRWEGPSRNFSATRGSHNSIVACLNVCLKAPCLDGLAHTPGAKGPNFGFGFVREFMPLTFAGGIKTCAREGNCISVRCVTCLLFRRIKKAKKSNFSHVAAAVKLYTQTALCVSG
jgi:hypothetical protein